MRDYLLFRLYGPMASWGDIAVGEYRPTFVHPTKSAILGLLAAAKGIARDEDETHRRMAESYGFSVCAQSPGLLVRDYHTIQPPPGGENYYTRREELIASKRNAEQKNKNAETILSTRDYRCDAHHVVSICILTNNAPYPLSELEEKLKKPEFVLYLGRKSCPLALPLEPQIIQADTVREAFNKAQFKLDHLLGEIEKEKVCSYYWEGKSKEGFDGYEIHSVNRRDVPLSRRRWQFEEREEHLAIIKSEE